MQIEGLGLATAGGVIATFVAPWFKVCVEKRRRIDLFERQILFAAIGSMATFAAPWLEFRGAYAAWSVVEWHTFWRGENAFQLASVVATDYIVPIEYATAAMPALVRALFMFGCALGVWHGGIFCALLIAGARSRACAGVRRSRVAIEIVAFVIVNAGVLLVLGWLLALPSTLTPKIDFRAGVALHTDSLTWSSVTLLPAAPALALIAVAGQIALWVVRVREFR